MGRPVSEGRVGLGTGLRRLSLEEKESRGWSCQGTGSVRGKRAVEDGAVRDGAEGE